MKEEILSLIRNLSVKTGALVLFFLYTFSSAFASNHLTQSNLVWGVGMGLHCDVKPHNFNKRFLPSTSYINTRSLKDYDIVWVNPDFLEHFVAKVLPKIKVKIILLANPTDSSFPNCLKKTSFQEKLLSSEKIVHIFAQNSTLSSHPKVTQIPIGIDFHTLACNKQGFGETSKTSYEQEQILLTCAESSTMKEKKMAACADFHFNDTMKAVNRIDLFFGENRSDIHQQLKDNRCVHFFKDRRPRTELWLRKIQYNFSVCPPGNGLDTHRVWEDLVLGLIPIVKTSPLDPLYKQFPIVIVKDWAEINEANLEKWYQEKKPLFYQDTFKKKITQKYWLDLMDKKKNRV